MVGGCFTCPTSDHKDYSKLAKVLVLRCRLGLPHLSQAMARSNFTPEKDIPDLQGKVFLITGGQLP